MNISSRSADMTTRPLIALRSSVSVDFMVLINLLKRSISWISTVSKDLKAPFGSFSNIEECALSTSSD